MKPVTTVVNSEGGGLLGPESQSTHEVKPKTCLNTSVDTNGMGRLSQDKELVTANNGSKDRGGIKRVNGHKRSLKRPEGIVSPKTNVSVSKSTPGLAETSVGKKVNKKIGNR
jgi:hypothetical protein